VFRVATNLETLEHSGNSLNLEYWGNFQGKIITNKIILVRSNISIKQLLTG